MNDENNRPGYELMTAEEVTAACQRLLAPMMPHLRPLCKKISLSLPWEERAQQIIAETDEYTLLCRERACSLEDARFRRFVITMHIAGLRELYDGSYYEPKPSEDSYREHLGRVASSFKALLNTVRERSEANSPQSKYAEAQLSARRLLGGPDFLEDFPKLTGFVNERSSSQLYDYTQQEVLLDVDDYFDAMHMIARDGANAAEIPNPPARVLTALNRKKLRQEILDRERMAELPKMLKNPTDLEATATVNIDFENAITGLGLSADQQRLLLAQMNGLKPQESGAGEYLGWDRKKLDSVRRSLAPDRAAGKRLRAKLADYAPPETFADKKNLDHLS